MGAFSRFEQEQVLGQVGLGKPTVCSKQKQSMRSPSLDMHYLSVVKRTPGLDATYLRVGTEAPLSA